MRYLTKFSLILVLFLFSISVATSKESSQKNSVQKINPSDVNKKIEQLALEQQQSAKMINDLQAKLNELHQKIDMLNANYEKKDTSKVPKVHGHGR